MRVRRPRAPTYTGRVQEVSPFRTRSRPSWPASSDGILDSLRERLDCTIRLRGNRLTIEGDEPQRRRRRAIVVERARRARRGRPRDRPEHRRRRSRRARPGRGHPRGLRRRRLAPPRQEDRAEDGQPEALRRRDPRLHDHVRDRARGHRQDVPRHGARGRGAVRSARSGGSSSRGRRSRPASGSASCPATSSPRSTRTCGRSSTRSTTCSTPTGSRRTWRRARSRSRRSRSCAAARSTTRSSSSTRRRTRAPSRCRCSSRGSASARRSSSPATSTQIDLPREQASGLIHVQDILGSIDGIAFIRFGNEDVVRHKLVQRIVEAYKLHAEETGTQRRGSDGRDRDREPQRRRGRRGRGASRSRDEVLAAEGVDDGELGLALRRAGRDARR